MVLEKKICVLGLGYIGLPTSVMLATSGFDVHGVDTNPRVLDEIKSGSSRINEPGLKEKIEASLASGNLSLGHNPVASDIFLICVPTPFSHENSRLIPDMNFVHKAFKNISPLLKDDDLVILESTSPVGTTESLARLAVGYGCKSQKIHYAYCPERVLPGDIFNELKTNDRVVGGLTTEASLLASEFYNSFVSGEIHITTAKTAEMCKLTENSFRDVNLGFANELSIICDEEDIDVWELIKLANKHPRVDILLPGAGVGGHCIAIDPWFIVSRTPHLSKLVAQARSVNDGKPQWVANKIKSIVHEKKLDKEVIEIGILGLSYKPNVGDLRESPALHIVEMLRNDGFNLSCVEPNLLNEDDFPTSSLDLVVENADLLFVLVNHNEFFVQGIYEKVCRKIAFDFSGYLSSER